MCLCLFSSALSSLILASFYVHISQGTMKIIEEYRNSSKADNPLECYYLFQLNHDAACSVLKPKLLMSPSSFCLIM